MSAPGGKSRSAARAARSASGTRAARVADRRPRQASPMAPFDVLQEMTGLGFAARDAARELALASRASKNTALKVAADELRAQTAMILEANARDLAAVQEGRATPAFI